MRELLGLVRAGWLTATSYRVNMLFSLIGLGIGLVPLYFVAHALQPVAAGSIQTEGGEYFTFVVVGLGIFTLISTAVSSLPSAVSGGISSGVLEAMLATPARLPGVTLGLVGYDLCWSAIRASIMIAIGVALGPGFSAGGLPIALLAVLLLLACYFGVGLALAGMILVLRTIGPLGTGVITGSALLGGVYYSTSVIPSWIQQLSVIVPLTYGLRIIRRALLSNAGWTVAGPDLLPLTGLALGLLLIGGVAFSAGLRHARREGTLAQY